ncbi:MAG TPA: peroxidase family protein [Tepidisphaeraceae bacterium]|nr:peroxidase family protein [Tepidisphaeraceae bacterium]
MSHSRIRYGENDLVQQLNTAADSVMEPLEARILFAADIRTLDGTGNNLAHLTWGSTNVDLLRLAPAQYGDGISSPAGANRPSARVISNAIAAHPADTEILSANHLSAFAYLWGQFIDHDLDLTTTSASAGEFDVPVPSGDPQFDPAGTGTQVIPLTRSTYDPATGATTPRQQINVITAFLDASMVYGSDAARAAALRAFVGGRLLTSAGGLLPFNTNGLANANDAHIFPDNQLFLAGDVRANENSELTSLQTLFVREHNRLAGNIAAQHPNWSDEQLFQEARRLVIGEIQSITYNEFLPALLGQNALGRYTGYNPSVNAGISTEFSTAAYRLGHSMLTDDVEFINNDGTDARAAMSLSQVFFNPSVVESTGIDPIVKYLASSNSEEIDNKVVDSVRNFLFGPPGAGGLDLASLNIQRGRDHGLADYNTTRASLGLPRITGFGQITSDRVLAGKLQSLYGSVDNIDLWVGGLAEDHAPGSNVGPTFQRILVDQFTRTRSGDRFWYQRDLSPAELSMVNSITLADVIAVNTGISNLQPNVFVFDVHVTGQIYYDRNTAGHIGRGETGVGNMTVNLVASDGTIVNTTITSRDGHYRLSNIQLGDYTVVPVLPSGAWYTTATPVTINVTRGGWFTNVDFGVGGLSQQNPPHQQPVWSWGNGNLPSSSWLDLQSFHPRWKDLLV